MEKDEIITKSYSGPVKLYILGIISIGGWTGYSIYCKANCLFWIIPIICLIVMFFISLNFFTVMTLNKNGCKVKIFFKEKEIPWEEMEMKYFCRPYGYTYKEAVIFGIKKCNKVYCKELSYHLAMNPLSYFVIYFEGMYNERITEDMQTCFVDKNLFMQKMQEWGIVLETDQIIDETEFLDKKGRLRPRKPEAGWRILALGLWFVLAAFVIYLLIYEVDAGEIIIGFPFFVFFFIAYKMVSGLRSSKLWMDEKGCVRKFLFFKKRYPWKKLRVKPIYSPNSHCHEGMLFIKKSRRKSDSAGESYGYTTLHPYRSFLVEFEKQGKKFGDRDIRYEISKDLFFRKMKEWGVEVEGR